MQKSKHFDQVKAWSFFVALNYSKKEVKKIILLPEGRERMEMNSFAQKMGDVNFIGNSKATDGMEIMTAIFIIYAGIVSAAMGYLLFITNNACS